MTRPATKLLGVCVGIFSVIFFSHLFFPEWRTSPIFIAEGEKIGREEKTQALEREAIPTPLESATGTITQIKSLGEPRENAQVPLAFVSAPGALIVEKPRAPSSQAGTPQGDPSKEGALNQKDIVDITNAERTKAGLPTLQFNQQLSAIAEVKARDMIARQYFEHVAPDGTDVAKLALREGYAYVHIGENLALGNFTGSADVVLGWMNSPGHRENILNEDYTEIGIAAILGNWEGKRVWFAVQEFGKPLPDCPKPDALLEEKIKIYESQINALEGTLENLREELETPGIDKQTYNNKVGDYNTIIALYNNLITTTKAAIELYNKEARTYNSCLEG